MEVEGTGSMEFDPSGDPTVEEEEVIGLEAKPSGEAGHLMDQVDEVGEEVIVHEPLVYGGGDGDKDLEIENLMHDMRETMNIVDLTSIGTPGGDVDMKEFAAIQGSHARPRSSGGVGIGSDILRLEAVLENSGFLGPKRPTTSHDFGVQTSPRQYEGISPKRPSTSQGFSPSLPPQGYEQQLESALLDVFHHGGPGHPTKAPAAATKKKTTKSSTSPSGGPPPRPKTAASAPLGPSWIQSMAEKKKKIISRSGNEIGVLTPTGTTIRTPATFARPSSVKGFPSFGSESFQEKKRSSEPGTILKKKSPSPLVAPGHIKFGSKSSSTTPTLGSGFGFIGTPRPKSGSRFGNQGIQRPSTSSSAKTQISLQYPTIMGDVPGGDGVATTGKSLKYSFGAFSRFGDTASDGKQITLSNADKWMKQAHVIDGKKITTTDTSIAFKKLFKTAKKVGFEDFKRYVEDLAASKKMESKEIFDKLAECGAPGLSQATKSQGHAGVVGRLTDPSKYTGSHKERFDSAGKGRGLEGRRDTPDNSGYVAAFKDKLGEVKKEDSPSPSPSAVTRPGKPN